MKGHGIMTEKVWGSGKGDGQYYRSIVRRKTIGTGGSQTSTSLEKFLTYSLVEMKRVLGGS